MQWASIDRYSTGISESFVVSSPRGLGALVSCLLGHGDPAKSDR